MKAKYTTLNTAHLFFLVGLLAACTNTTKSTCHSCFSSTKINQATRYLCENVAAYKGKVVGDGHCVSLVQHCSDAPQTNFWRPGQRVWKNDIQAGRVIATFKNDRYPNTTGFHSAIYIRQDEHGIWVWDQWQGKAVHQRLIKWRNDGATNANTAQSYHTVTSID